MKQFDVTVCPQNYSGTQWSIEVDAAGEEEACECARWYFSRFYRQHVTVTTITEHRYRKPKPITFTVRMKEMV